MSAFDPLQTFNSHRTVPLYPPYYMGPAQEAQGGYMFLTASVAAGLSRGGSAAGKLSG